MPGDRFISVFGPLLAVFCFYTAACLFADRRVEAKWLSESSKLPRPNSPRRNWVVPTHTHTQSPFRTHGARTDPVRDSTPVTGTDAAAPSAPARECKEVTRGGVTMSSCDETLVVYSAVPFFGDVPPWSGWTTCPSSGFNVLATSDDSAASYADAVIYHARDTPSGPLAERGHPGQARVLMTAENQQTFDHWEQNRTAMARFDLLASFHLSSDIVITYLAFHGLQHAIRAPGVPFEERRSDALVAWAVRNCDFAASNRLAYFSALRRHIPVHAFGACDANAEFRSDNRAAQDEELRHYLFYFSAENIVCDDYLTEKFFRALAHGTVPILYGPSNVAALAPTTDSYVDVRDFASPEQLAKHLRAVATDRGRYERYLRWKTLPEEELNPAFRDLLHEEQWMCRLGSLLRDNAAKGRVYKGGLRPLPACRREDQNPGWDPVEMTLEESTSLEDHLAGFWDHTGRWTRT